MEQTTTTQTTAPTETATPSLFASFAELAGVTKETEAAPVEAAAPAPEAEKKSVEEPTTDVKPSAVRESFELAAKAEKKAREIREKFESERKAFEIEKASFISKSEVKRLLEEKGVNALKDFEIDPDSLVRRHFANDGKDPEYQINELKKEIESLRNMTKEDKERAITEQVKAAEAQQEANINQYKNYIKEHVLKSGEKYEFLAEVEGFENEAFRAWFEIGQKTGTPANLDEVLTKINEQVEKTMEEKFKTSKVTSKLLKKLGLVEAPNKEEPVKPFTLSNLIPTSPPVAKEPENSKRIPTDDERIRDAVAAFQAARSGRA
jgi:hypothetical protein